MFDIKTKLSHLIGILNPQALDNSNIKALEQEIISEFERLSDIKNTNNLLQNAYDRCFIENGELEKSINTLRAENEELRKNNDDRQEWINNKNELEGRNINKNS